MRETYMEFTRRELMAGIGGGSIVIGGFVIGRPSPRFSRYTYSAPEDDTDDGLLRIAWYESYNGAFLENQGGTDDGYEATMDPATEPEYVQEASLVTDARGPVVSLQNVLPGDSGTLVVGLEVVDETTSALDLWFRASITADDENGLIEPETEAGDASSDDGELDDEAFVEMWVDNSPLGACDGLRNLDERLRAPVVVRAPFGEAFGPTSDVADTDGVRVFDSCLEPGTLRCVAFSWELPEDASNRSQGDSIEFDFSFAGGPCGGDSPFLVGGNQ